VLEEAVLLVLVHDRQGEGDRRRALVDRLDQEDVPGLGHDTRWPQVPSRCARVELPCPPPRTGGHQVRAQRPARRPVGDRHRLEPLDRRQPRLLVRLELRPLPEAHAHGRLRGSPARSITTGTIPSSNRRHWRSARGVYSEQEA
jgi:hypothetical protein